MKQSLPAARLLLVLLGAALVSAASFAQNLTLMLSQPAAPAAADQSAAVSIYAMNESPKPVGAPAQRHLAGRLSWDSESADVDLLLVSAGAPEAVVPPGGFIKREYRFIVPPNATGPATLTIGAMTPVRFTVLAAADVTNPPAPAPAAATVAGTAPAAAAAPQGADSRFGAFIGRRIFPYEPIYFIIGTYPSVEFQFSLKFELIDFARRDLPFGTLYFGYTQTSFWDLLTADPSFYDTSYRPSFFLSQRIASPPAGLRSLDVQYGYEHESNGAGGLMERSLNRVYLQTLLAWGAPGRPQFTLQPRVWSYLNVGQHNPDLAAYRGYADLRAAVTARIWQLAARFGLGSHGTHPSLTLDLRIDPRRPRWSVPVQIRYFTGYGQNLRDYNKRDHGVRVGFSLWYPH